MREYIAKRLDEMKNSEDRAFLRSVMSDVFLPLYDEAEQKYMALEQRVRNELPLVYDAFTIYSTVLQCGHVDSNHTYLSPMLSDDATELTLDSAELAAAVSRGEQPVIETVFFEADYLECSQIIKEKRILSGEFTVKSEQYPFRCFLQPAAKYKDYVESLYSVFLRNDVPWTTINSAYISKFFEVRITELSRIPPRGEKITAEQIQISFAPYSEKIKRGLVPVWNVDEYHVKGEDFPMPVLDSVNYEYHFETDILGEGNGFLVDYSNEYILNTRREDGTLVIVSPKQKGLNWLMYRLRRRHDSAVDIYPYPIISNARVDAFSNRLMTKYGTHISTRAELRKLLESFDVSEYVELVDLHFAGTKLSGDTYDMNPFIKDEIRDPDFQKTLSLAFKAKNRDFFLNRDIVSFLISELQATYPEYRCVGTLA